MVSLSDSTSSSSSSSRAGPWSGKRIVGILEVDAVRLGGRGGGGIRRESFVLFEEEGVGRGGDAIVLFNSNKFKSRRR